MAPDRPRLGGRLVIHTANAAAITKTLPTDMILVDFRTDAPNDQRSHAGPLKLRSQQDEILALADAAGSVLTISSCPLV